jgi:hypothetical protein
LWLRWGNLLTYWVVLGLAGGLIAVEWLIRLRERSLWQPPLPTEQPLPDSDSHDQAA